MPLNPEITDWRGKRVWLLGASAGIGAALARALAARGARLALSGRHAEALNDLCEALPGDGHFALTCDAVDDQTLLAAREEIERRWKGLDLAVYLAGDYVPLRAWNFTPAQAKQLCEVNYLGAANFTHVALPLLAGRHAGGLVLVSSVAGYRGLPKALAYGPPKAALINFAETLYLDLHPRGHGVWLVNPGFVATRLTAGNDFRMPALMTPDAAAAALIKGLASGDFEIHFPRRFTCFLKLLRLLPYRLYFKVAKRTTGE